MPCSVPPEVIPNPTVVSDKVRSKLQSGQMSAGYNNEQLKDFFTNDLERNGDSAEVKPIPEGDVSFIFCMIKGRKSKVQSFIDSGCNCVIAKDGHSGRPEHLLTKEALVKLATSLRGLCEARVHLGLGEE